MDDLSAESRYQSGFANPLIRSDQGQAVYAGGSGDCAVHRVAEDAEMGSIFRDFKRHREQLKLRVGLYLGEKLFERSLQHDSVIADKHCNFEQSHGAECQWLSFPNCGFEHAELSSRQFLPVAEPTDQNVSVEEKAGEQSQLLETVIEMGCIIINDVANDLDLPGQTFPG